MHTYRVNVPHRRDNCSEDAGETSRDRRELGLELISAIPPAPLYRPRMPSESESLTPSRLRGPPFVRTSKLKLSSVHTVPREVRIHDKPRASLHMSKAFRGTPRLRASVPPAREHLTQSPATCSRHPPLCACGFHTAVRSGDPLVLRFGSGATGLILRPRPRIARNPGGPLGKLNSGPRKAVRSGIRPERLS